MFLSGPRFPAAGRPPRAFLPRQRLYLSRLRRGDKERTAALERSQLQWLWVDVATKYWVLIILRMVAP